MKYRKMLTTLKGQLYISLSTLRDNKAWSKETRGARCICEKSKGHVQ
jgi:hypothetical protein